MRGDPEKLAWVVLLASFCVFCVLLVSIPLTIRWYLINATVSHEATLEAIMGTVLVWQPGANAPMGVTGSATVTEGSRILTDASSRAFVTFFDNSTATFSFDTEARLASMRSPRFGLSNNPNNLHLELLRGQANVGAAIPMNGPLEFRVTSPHMVALLKEGSYSLKVTPDTSRTIVHLGSAEVSANGRTVTLDQRERTTVKQGQPPAQPLAAAQNLLTNGSFQEDLEVGWQSYNEQGGDGGDADGEISVVELADSDSRAVRFFRAGSGGNHCETVVQQNLGEEISDLATSISLYLQVRLVNQSLSGGGYLSSEYPLMIRLEFQDVYGSPSQWTHGFYYQNEDNNPTMYGERVAHNVWVEYASGNILETIYPRPARLNSLLIYASGWDYESMVTDVSLVVE